VPAGGAEIYIVINSLSTSILFCAQYDEVMSALDKNIMFYNKLATQPVVTHNYAQNLMAPKSFPDQGDIKNNNAKWTLVFIDMLH
jgi:hypothetical protein